MGKAIIVLSIIALVLVAALGLVLLKPESITTVTSTETSTLMPARQAAEIVANTFSKHLLLFTSRNVSAIVSQYQPNANVTWEGAGPCLSGLFPISDGSFVKLLDLFFQYRLPQFQIWPQGFHTILIGNVTQIRTTGIYGSANVNSTFVLEGQDIIGNLTSTVSAQDSYRYSRTSDTWLISQETWHFLNLYTQGNALVCKGF
jgi:hypothetical protein